MRINNNLMAINTHRQLSINTTSGAKSIEKLSSGYRINRAGDDAAGLAISEKMRGQIRGLNQASRNAQDDISLIQTTEGALNETHAIIQRMREMAVQSSNDTNTDDDRAALQNEMNQLAEEITRIANTTEFNTRKLLNGNLDANTDNSTGDLTFHIGANTNQNMKYSVLAMDAFSLNLTEDIEEVQAKQVDMTIEGVTIKSTAGEALANDYTIIMKKDDSATAATTVDHKAKTITVVTKNDGNVAGTVTPSGTPPKNAAGDDVVFTVTGTLGVDNASGKTAGGVDAVEESKSSAATFVADQKGVVEAEAKVAKGIDISTQESANLAIDRIDSALKAVSDQRAELGAVQNRLEHTIKNLDTSAENLQASESRIRDVDMAKEMMEFTKNNILQQAAQSMLAQANQAPQGVLQLLR